MSTRTYITLHKDGKEISSHQIFGNDDFFESFDAYLKSIDIPIGEEGIIYQLDENNQIIPHPLPDLSELMTAIETVILDKVNDNPSELLMTYQDPEYQKLKIYRPTNPIFDLSSRLLVHDPYDDKVQPFYNTEGHINLATRMVLAIEQSYMFTTYNLINWLKEKDALVKKTAHVNYYLKPELKNGFSLGIERF